MLKSCGKVWYNGFQWLEYDMDSITLFGLVTLSETGHWEYAETSH